MQNQYYNIITVSHRLLWMLIVLALATLARDSVGQTPATAFTQSFDYTKTRISVLPQSKWGVFRVADTVTIATSNNLPITVYDLYGRTVYTGSPVSRSFAEGHYFVECTGDRNQFCVLPNDYTTMPFLGDQGNQGDHDAMQRDTLIGVGWRRVGRDWGVIQTGTNQFNWSIVDDEMNAKLDCNILLGGAGYIPSWVNATNIITAYTNYVAALVQRYKGKIAAFELWNEPGAERFPVSDWSGLLGQLITEGAKTVRAIDPSIKIVGPAWWSSFADTRPLAATGALAALDVFSWHDYQLNDAPPDQIVPYPPGAWVISNLVQRVSRYRDSGVTTDSLFVDEIGLYAGSALGVPYPSPPAESISPLIDWRKGMNRSIKLAALYRAAGVQTLFPHQVGLPVFSLTDVGNANYGWEYGSRGPQPKTSAFLMTCYWLNGAQFVDYRTLQQKVCLFAWRRPDNTAIVFAWTVEGQVVALNGSVALKATDIFGGSVTPASLTETPVLFYSTSQDAPTLLANVIANLPYLNLPPVISPVANQSAQIGQTLQLVVSATDPDNEPITYSASSLPAGATINPTTGLFFWIPGPSQAGSYTITFTATDSRGMSSSTSTILTAVGSVLDGLAHRWKLDETSGTVAYDSVGSCSGVLTGFGAVSPWVAGKNGMGLNLVGSNSYVNLDSTQINLTNNFTISTWVYPRDSTIGGLLGATRFRYQNSGFWFWIGGNAVVIGGQTTTGWKANTFALGQIQNNTWYQLVLVYDKSTWRVYLNGQLVTIAYGGNSFWDGDFVMDRTAGSSIGGNYRQYLNGILDDVMIFSRTLSPSEVTTLYQGSTNTTPPRPPTSLTLTAN